MNKTLGLICSRRNRQTKKIYSLYDGDEAGMDTSSGRWQVVCEEHKAVCSLTKKEAALRWLSNPLIWCERCSEL